jgi:hypothetical protein
VDFSRYVDWPSTAKVEYHLRMRAHLTLLCSLWLAGTAAGQTIPTPESVLGHKPGDDFYLATYDESRAYFQKLAASSNRIKLINVGKTTRGLDWEIAIISSPENLAKLDHYKDISRRLAQARGLTDDQARALAKEGKAIVHLDGGLHASEVAGAQHTINLAYKLVSTQGDPQVDAILNNVILMLWPTLNPDGQNQVALWYRQNVGTPYEVSPLPDLWQEYVGHDNNRDGYMNNMLESQDVTRTELEWDPVVFYCHHQTAPFPTRIFIPPFTEPISSNIHPLMARWLNFYGIGMAAYLDEHGMPGAVHRVGFDNWYAGFLDFTHIFRNSISFFTETALYRYATPHFYTTQDFPRERQDLQAQVFYSSPWTGGWWRLADAVRYMQGASMSVLDMSAKYREELLFNRYQAGRDNIEKFRKQPPYAYVIPQDQADAPTAAVLVSKMLINGIEVHQASQAFPANGREYKAGTWVILMDQPFAALAKELFEVQKYPDLRESPNGPPILPYDVAGWTLPLQMGVEVATVIEPLTAAQRNVLKRIDKVAPLAGGVQGSGSVFVFSHRQNASFQAMHDAFAAGATIGFAKTPEAGAIVVSGLAENRVAEIAAKYGLNARAMASAPEGTQASKKPRVGLYRSWNASIDEGWTRWILENYGFAPVTLRNGDIQAGHLRERLDTIVIADASTRSIMDGYAVGTVPGQYAGGLGETGVEAIRAFVRGGGTLVAFNNASLFAIEQLNLPVTNVLKDLKNEQFFCRGSLLHVELRDAAAPGNWGLAREPIVFFESGPAFETKTGFKGTVLAAYPRERNPLASGYLLHPERIQGKIAALEADVDQGRVYLLAFRPQWRGQSHGTYKFVFNAIYDAPNMTRPAAAPVTARAAAGGDAWPVAARVHSNLSALLKQNRAFFAARGPAAIDERAKLNAAVEQFEKDRIPEVEDAAAALEGAAKQKGGEYARALRRAAADLKAKEFEPAVDDEAFLERYRLGALEQEITAKPK